MFKLNVITALFLTSWSCLFAQDNQYQFSQLDITNGLSNNRVNGIYKDAQGFMWFATALGLSRYDGYEFKVFKHVSGDNTSLYSNYVEKINEGPESKIWVFTNNGISVYDPNTEKFSNDISVCLNKYHVASKQLVTLIKDGDGNFWFLTKDKGAYYYNISTGITVNYSALPVSKVMLHSSGISAVVKRRRDFAWMIFNDGVIEKLAVETNKVKISDGKMYAANSGKVQPYVATDGDDGNLWIHVTNSPSGIYKYNTATGTLVHLIRGVAGSSINSNVINSVIKVSDHTLWIGTDHGGINIFNTQTNKIIYLENKADDAKSLRGNSVTLYKDNTGIIWAGTTKQGVSYYHKGIIQFPLVRHYILDNSSLPYEDVDCFVEDGTGNFWIGTNGGGLVYFNRKTGKYTQYKHSNAHPGSLSNDVVISLCIDHQQNLWVGTYFGGMDKLQDGKFKHYRHNDKIPGSISDDRVYSIIEDSDNRLWAGTFMGKLNIYDPQNNQFIHPDYSMVSDYTEVIFEDREKNIWIGRDKGIDVIEKNKGSVIHFTYQPNKKNTLIANDVNCIIQDHNGLIWIGTKEGLSIYNPKTNTFFNIQEKQGLPSNNVWGIVEDNNNRMWLSTANGIARIKFKGPGTAEGFEIGKYNGFDGLQGNEFNSNAAYKLKSGEIIFGGAHGYNLFNPDKINAFNVKPNLLFTDFQLFNKSVSVGDTINGEVILKSSISKLHALTLTHTENVFSISFAACDYYNPDKIVYQYKLEGFDKAWLTSPGSSRTATYTNLDAGNYTFMVRALNTNARSNLNTANIRITILPPFWKSAFAYLIYGLMAVGLLFYIRHRGIRKLKMEFKMSQEKREAERTIANEREAAKRMHELDLMKIKFFTNVSHEFRTPLSLIISPIDQLIKNNEHAQQHNQLLMIKRNSRRLLNLVNQLLDFRKMESKELKLNLQKGDIIKFIKEVATSFTDLAEQNQIAYLIDSEVNTLFTSFDQDKIERILFNLLSNAFKFTPAGGHISIMLRLEQSALLAGQIAEALEIKIIDTGIGIPKEKLEKVFERFYQVDMPDGLLNQGSGIGLSISSEFVKMHSGEIYAESEPGNGSSFTITLPVVLESEKDVPAVNSSHEAEQTLKHISQPADMPKKPLILVVDDNDDLRFYLKDNLKHIFNIVEAVNGKDGWQKALALHPHLIVSDVNMPELNGLELCKKIKHDNRTSHIPLILLTALTEDDDQLIGLTNGANDYISKPFNFEILLSKINGLLAMQEAFKKTFQKQREIHVQDLQIISEDEKFLKAVFNCIEKNITNYNFSVEELSRQMSLSRVSLYKRLLTLTGKTPVDCIRTIRLKRAVQLLEKSKLSIANIAYEVGFNNPTYFSKVFKDEYGVVPSEYFNNHPQPSRKEHLESD